MFEKLILDTQYPYYEEEKIHELFKD